MYLCYAKQHSTAQHSTAQHSTAQHSLKQLIFSASFLLAFFGFSQVSCLYIAPEATVSGVENLRVVTPAQAEESSTASGTVYVHNPQNFFAQNSQLLSIVLVNSLPEAKTYHKPKKATHKLFVTPKKTTNPARVLVATPISPLGVRGLTADATPLLPTPTQLITATPVATYLVTNNQTQEIEHQATGYHKNTKAYTLAIAYCNRPPPC